MYLDRVTQSRSKYEVLWFLFSVDDVISSRENGRLLMNPLVLRSQGQGDCQGRVGYGHGLGVIDSASSVTKRLCFSFITIRWVGGMTPGQ